TPTAGQFGNDAFTIEVTDGRGGIATSTETMIINRRPTANADAATVNQDQSITIDVLANDSDPDGDPIQLPTSAIKTPPAVGTATRASNTAITYSAANSGASTSTFFDYFVNDSRNAQSSARVTI